MAFYFTTTGSLLSGRWAVSLLYQAVFQEQLTLQRICRQHTLCKAAFKHRGDHHEPCICINSFLSRAKVGWGSKIYKNPCAQGKKKKKLIGKQYARLCIETLFCNIRGSSLSLIRCRLVNHLTTKKLQEWKGNPQGKAELKQMPIIKGASSHA